jgi:hypothetical protein
MAIKNPGIKAGYPAAIGGQTGFNGATSDALHSPTIKNIHGLIITPVARDLPDNYSSFSITML